MNFNNNYNFSDFKVGNNTFNRNTSHYIGLNRITNKKQRFFFQPNQMNIINSAEYQKIPNVSNFYYKNNLNKSTDINNFQTVNTSQIKQRMAKLNNEIKKLNGLFQQKSKNFSENKNNSYIINDKKGSNLGTNYVLFNNESNQGNLNNYQKLNQTYKINNNINKNYYITYDLKKMKFNINNSNVNSHNNYSDNELFKRKFSQSSHGKKNTFNNYNFSNKSDFNNNNEVSNYSINQFYKTSSIYKGINKNKNNFGINVKGFNINENNNNEYDKNNIMNYNILKKNLLVQRNNQNQKRNYSQFTPSRNYNNNNNNNYNINKNMIIYNNNNNKNTKIKSNLFEKNNINNNNNFNMNNKNTLNNADDDNSDELSDLADEFIQAFNIDIISDGEIQENLKKNKSSNIYYNNTNDYFSKNDFQGYKSKSKEITMNIINNKTKTSPKINENNFIIKNNEIKEIKPFNESFQLDESLIHDSQLDIPLIKETLIHNKVMKGKNNIENKDKAKIILNKEEKNILNDIEKINLNKNENLPMKIEDLVEKQKYDNNIFESNKENKDEDDNNKIKQNGDFDLKNINENNIK